MFFLLNLILVLFGLQSLTGHSTILVAKRLNNLKLNQFMEGLKMLLVSFEISLFLCERLQAKIFSNLGRNRTGEAMVLDLVGFPLQYSTGNYNPVSQDPHTTCNLIDFPFYQALWENTQLHLFNYTAVSGLH